MPITHRYCGSLCDVVGNAFNNRTLNSKFGFPKDELSCGVNSANQWAIRTGSDKQEQIRNRAVTYCG